MSLNQSTCKKLNIVGRYMVYPWVNSNVE